MLKEIWWFVPYQILCAICFNISIFIAVTVISHDSKDEARVDSCEEKKCYVRNVNYDIPMSSIRSIVRQSQNCRQKVKVMKNTNKILIRLHIL